MEQRGIILCSPRAAAFALLLAASTTVLAHDHITLEASPTLDMDMSSHSSHSSPSTSTLSTPMEAKPSYFRHEDYHWILLAHIVIMSISWIFVLPVSIMLTISRSKFRLPVQFSFLVLNAVGVFASIMYNAKTPDLYPGNTHHSLGWVVTWIVGVQMILALLNAYTTSGDESKEDEEEYRPLNVGEMQSGWVTGDGQYVKEEQRYLDDSGEGASLRSSSSTTLNGDHESHEPLQDIPLKRTQGSGSRFTSKYLPGSVWTKFDMASTFSGHTLRFSGISESVLVRAIMPFGHATFLAGIATYGGLFRGHEIFSGLAHWIKGSVFFWYGLLTLGRWAGCFADRGWAWNMLPAGSKKRYSAEFVESFLIFFYGVTNVFLEHLSNWDEAWSMMDLQHLGITILFAGGGLVSTSPFVDEISYVLTPNNSAACSSKAPKSETSSTKAPNSQPQSSNQATIFAAAWILQKMKRQAPPPRQQPTPSAPTPCQH